MSYATQLNPPLWLNTPKGEGLAHLMIDYGPESSLYWVVFCDDGAIWTFPNEYVRACRNATMERATPSQPPSFEEFKARRFVPGKSP